MAIQRDISQSDAGGVKSSVETEPERRTSQAGGNATGHNGHAAKFLANVIRSQRLLGPTHGGAVLAAIGDSQTKVLAIAPAFSHQKPPLWLKQAAEQLHAGLPADGLVTSLGAPVAPGDTPPRLFLHPVACTGADTAAIVLVASAGDAGLLERRRRLLADAMRPPRQAITPNRPDESNVPLSRLEAAILTTAAINMHDHYRSAAMAFCNEIASRWRCDRTSVGFLKGRCVRLEAMSQVERFDRKRQVIHDLEAVMEECVDQDCEVLHPASLDAIYVSREVVQFSKRHGPMAVVSLPLRRKGEVLGAMAIERSADRPWTPEEVEALRMACDLCTPRLLELRRHDRWLGARIAGEARRVCALAVGTQHTFAKLLAILVCGILAFLIFAKGPYRIEAPFVLEAEQKHVVCAPFDGFIESASLEVGGVVMAGETVLASMDTAELVLRKAEAQAEQDTYAKQVATAMRDGKIAEAQIARAYIAKINAQMALLDHYLQHARITAPVSGTIINGDLKRQIGAPVKIGDVLFELTPLKSLRAELLVPEEEVPEIVVGQHGQVATVSYPDRRIEFTVEQINPIAEVVGQRNVFRIRCQLAETPRWLRPGMEGLGKISIGQRHYSWMWTRKAVKWIRMKLWL